MNEFAYDDPSPGHPVVMQDKPFDKVVSLKFGDEWIAIASAEEALRCLQQNFPNRDGGSYRRALSNCEAFLAGEVSMIAVRSSFVVAAMAAGIRFELHDDMLSFLDFQLAFATEESVRRSRREAADMAGSSDAVDLISPQDAEK